MLDHRPFDSLGQFDIDWLQARYHFSFGSYSDPARMGWGPLRVWNDDRIQPGGGFDLHPHRNMEIITYVRHGALSHIDHLDNEGRTEAGDVQVMSAGRGIVHGEFNRETDITQVFQIWIHPAAWGGPPSWDQRHFPREARAGTLVPLASGRAGHADALSIRQDAALLGATLRAGERLCHDLDPGRLAYLVPAAGRVTVNGLTLAPRDGLAVAEVTRLDITAVDDGEMLLLDLPPAARA